MKLKYKSADRANDQSFYIRRQHDPVLDSNWHHHEEIELIYIIRGGGIRIVGDNLSNFRLGQLVLVGPWLPHLWKNSENYTGDETVDVIVIKFASLIGGQEIFSNPEFSGISHLLHQSQRGLLFNTETVQKVHDFLLALTTSEGADRIINLQLVLKLLSECKDIKALASPEFTPPTSFSGENRLSRIINYISDNFTGQLGLEELAIEAAMTPFRLLLLGLAVLILASVILGYANNV